MTPTNAVIRANGFWRRFFPGERLNQPPTLHTHTRVRDSNGSDPQSDGAQERVHRAAICVRIVDVHVSCSSHCEIGRAHV